MVLWSDRFLGSRREMVERDLFEPSIAISSTRRYGPTMATSTPIFGSIDMVPITLKSYGYEAIYFRKAAGFVCGLTYSDLPDSLFPMFHRNRGALVKHVIPGTPALNAHILVGDVVVGVNNLDIDSSATLSSLIDRTRGQTDTFIVRRNGGLRSMAVSLNP
jgi:hypothetical protein